MKYIPFFLIIFLMSCTKSSSTLICGDHECINRLEAKQYFEENLIIEVRVKKNGKESNYDLVDLNLKDKQKIKVLKKTNKKIVRKLSKEEVKLKKKQLKNKIINKNKEKSVKDKPKDKKGAPANILTQNTPSSSSDICLKLKKCDITSITNYLIKISNEKDFPNISSRE